MGSERAKLGWDEEESANDESKDGVDIGEIVGVKKNPEITNEQRQIIVEEAKKSGFISRQPKKRRKVSPYTAQFGGKCREGMKELFQEFADRKGLYDTQALELAILALFEKEQCEDLILKYMSLAGDKN